MVLLSSSVGLLFKSCCGIVCFTAFCTLPFDIGDLIDAAGVVVVVVGGSGMNGSTQDVRLTAFGTRWIRAALVSGSIRTRLFVSR